MKRRTTSAGRRLRLLVQRYAVALGGVTYALTLGMRRARYRALVSKLAAEFGYRAETRGQLPVMRYDVATDPSVAIVLPEVVELSGNVSPVELIALARLAAARRPRAVLEIGTFDGRTTVTLAANAPESTVVTLDLPPTHASTLPVEARDLSFINKQASGARFAGSRYASRIRQVYGDSATYDFSGMALDFAFIDGSHSYEYALSDSRRVRPLMRAGGVMLWHDYGGEWEGVTLALNQLSLEPDFSGLRTIEGTSLAILEIPVR